ncbi:MAG: class I SAM-dependent methyltransferase [Chlamydiota bacterium]|nr:class I SAM-dependent methyltransferase [Chlamydiota bacterium]
MVHNNNYVLDKIASGNKAFICPVCASDLWVGVYKVDIWTILQCRHCHFARVYPVPEEDHRNVLYGKDEVISRNKKKRNYIHQTARNLKKYSEKFRKSKSQYFFSKITQSVTPGSRLLDIGCGDGDFLENAKQNYQCYGLEISEYLALQARARGNLKIEVGRFPDKGLFQERFHAVTMLSLLEHLVNPREALKRCYELLEPGGVLFLKTVNYQCLNRRVMGAHWTGLRPPDHVVYFGPENLKKLMKDIGYRKVKISSWFLNDNMNCDAWK